MFDKQDIFNKTFGAIIIGSSPICLLRSQHLSKKGTEVIILEERDSLGGAWATISTNKFERVEFGAHLIGNYGKLIKLFSKRYDIPYKSLEYQPTAYLNSRFHKNSDWLWFKHDLKNLLKTLVTLDAYKFLIQLKNLVLYNSKSVWLHLKYNGLKDSDFVYMTNGCYELVGKLAKQSRTLGTIIQTNFLARELIIDTDLRSVSVNGIKDTVKSHRILIPRNAHFNKVTLDGTTYEPKTIEIIFRTIYIEIETDSPVKFSYLHLFSHSFFSRVSNITRTTLRKSHSDRHYLIAAQLNSNANQEIPLEDCAKELFQFLIDGLMIEDKSLLTDRFEFNFSRHIFGDSKFLNNIEKQSKGLVEILDSRTFTDSLNVYFKHLLS